MIHAETSLIPTKTRYTAPHIASYLNWILTNKDTGDTFTDLLLGFRKLKSNHPEVSDLRKLKFILQQAMNPQKGSRGTALLFL